MKKPGVVNLFYSGVTRMFDPALFGFAKEWYTFCPAKGAGEFRRSPREK